jgi:crotonobetainyl-CoA:carnitine CoA-transferase CaiB-like acyl-CoA transferase
MKTLTPERFNEILSAFQAKQTDTLATKAKEYSQDDNRLHNFDTAIKLINLVKPSDDRTYSMWCLNSKQLVSVIDILNEPDKEYTEAFLTEKFGDVMNYFMLMYADMVERNRKEPVTTLIS